MNTNNIIPRQNNGIETNTEGTTQLSTEQEAKQFFQEVKQRLPDVITGINTREGQLPTSN